MVDSRACTFTVSAVFMLSILNDRNVKIIDDKTEKRFYIVPTAWIKHGGVQKNLEIISAMMAGVESIMLLGDCIAEEGLDKRLCALAKLAISGRHCSHSL